MVVGFGLEVGLMPSNPGSCSMQETSIPYPWGKEWGGGLRGTEGLGEESQMRRDLSLFLCL